MAVLRRIASSLLSFNRDVPRAAVESENADVGGEGACFTGRRNIGEQGGTADEPEDSYADSKQSFDQTNYVSAVGMAALGKRQSGRL